jgi:branched-subunit amino acid aminotransferase/4-amino-4-deoxychorismate lyase
MVDLAKADGVFLTLSIYGVVEAVALDGEDLNRTPLTGRIHRGLQALIDQECGEQERA